MRGFAFGIIVTGILLIHTAKAQTMDDAVNRGNEECLSLARAGQLNSATEVAACMNQRFLKALETYRWQHMAAADDFALARLRIADEFDQGILTSDEMEKQIQGAYSDMLSRTAAESDAKARTQDAEIARAQAQLDAATARAEAQQRAAEARFGAGMLAPTRTGTFGESLGNGLGAYSGVPPPTAPRQTQCFPNGTGGFICQSQ